MPFALDDKWRLDARMIALARVSLGGCKEGPPFPPFAPSRESEAAAAGGDAGGRLRKSCPFPPGPGLTRAVGEKELTSPETEAGGTWMAAGRAAALLGPAPAA